MSLQIRSGTSSTSSSSSDWRTVGSVLVSFGAGVVTASLIYYWKESAFQQNNNNKTPSSRTNKYNHPPTSGGAETEDDDVAVGGIMGGLSRSSSFRWMHQSVEDLTNRIGELPSLRRRGHWPWDQPKSNRGNLQQQNINNNNTDPPESKRGVDEDNNGNHGDGTPGDSSSNNNNDDDDTQQSTKSPLCIGSIFGLDVGGTLAKLAYFESNEVAIREHETTSRAERLYRASASAQAVCMARRSRSPGGGGSTSNTSQANVPEQPQHVLNHHFSFHGESLASATITKTRRRQRARSKSWAPIFVSSETETEQQQQQRARPTLKHSDSSDEDLQTLAIRRQESVPGDLHAFAKATGHAQPDNDNNYDDDIKNKNDQTIPSKMRKVRSMFDLSSSSTSSADHAEALDRFYNFARRLDSYREGVRDHKLSFYSHELGGDFHFIRFETRRMQNAMDLIRANKLHLNIHSMGGTGGGAHKFAAQWRTELGIEMKKQDELDSLVAGMQFVLATVVGECYTFRPRQQQQQQTSDGKSTTPVPSTPKEDSRQEELPGMQNRTTDETNPEKTNTSIANDAPAPTWNCDNQSIDPFQDYGQPPVVPDNLHVSFTDDERPPIPSRTPSGESEGDHDNVDEWWWSRKVQRDSISYSSTYPYLVVTIGTGVSVIRVDGPRKYERVSGSTIGGGTYLGLIRLLTDVEDFDDILRLAERGDPSKVDMLVGDIYGENSDALEKLGLPSNLVASSFGKLVAKEDPAAGLKQEDLARALLFMITTNIGHVAYLNAKLMNTPRIYFVGNFLRQNLISQRRLSYAIYYWSKGEMEALFLEHEGYFGALGAFLLAQDIPSPIAAVNGTTGSRGGTETTARHRRRSTLEHPVVTRS